MSYVGAQQCLFSCELHEMHSGPCVGTRPVGAPKYEALKNSQNFETRVTSETGGQKGQKLAQLGAIDPRALLALARVAGHGNQKYDRYNMMKGYDWSLSFDAALRHLLAFWAGEDDDPESGEAHVAHAAWHFLNLYSYMLDHRDFDDRPPCRRESS